MCFSDHQSSAWSTSGIQGNIEVAKVIHTMPYTYSQDRQATSLPTVKKKLKEWVWVLQKVQMDWG